MKNNYIYVVSFMSVPDHYDVLVTTDIRKALTKKIESVCHCIEVWSNEIKIGTYGDLNEHSKTNYDIILNGILSIITKHESQ